MSLTLMVAAAGSLVGDWAYLPALRDARAPVELCETDNGIRYQSNARFTTFDGDVAGTWQLRGGRLTERITRERGKDGPRAVRYPSHVSRIVWLSRDHANIRTPAGTVVGLLRCRAAR